AHEGDEVQTDQGLAGNEKHGNFRRFSRHLDSGVCCRWCSFPVIIGEISLGWSSVRCSASRNATDGWFARASWGGHTSPGKTISLAKLPRVLVDEPDAIVRSARSHGHTGASTRAKPRRFARYAQVQGAREDHRLFADDPCPFQPPRA